MESYRNREKEWAMSNMTHDEIMTMIRARSLESDVEETAWTFDQLEVIKAIRDTSKWLTVMGPAGCGKTTVLTHCLPFAGNYAILAFTHAAANNYLGGRTIASFFKFLPLDPEAVIIEYSKVPSVSDEDAEVTTIFIDECSMVDENMLNDIMVYCAKNGVRLIGIGDHYQLPPVTDTTGYYCVHNQFFTHTDLFTLVKMTEVVRQKKGSGVLAFAEQFKQYHGAHFKTNFNNTEDFEWDKDLFLHKFMAMPGNNRILTLSNPDVDYFNKYVHEALYDVDWAVGEPVLLCENVYKSAGPGKFNCYSNGSGGVVTRNKILTTTCTDVNGTKHEIDSYNVSLRHDTGIEIVIRVPMDHEKKRLNNLNTEWIREYKSIKSKGWKDSVNRRFKLSGLRLFKSLKYKYASTIHKAQGATYDNTFIYPGGAMFYMRNKAEAFEYHNKLMYVASTRCKGNNYILKGLRK